MHNETIPIRPDAALDLESINQWIGDHRRGLVETIISATQYPGGYSNLTYLLEGSAKTQYVLRRPPLGAKSIKGGHDMLREYRILSTLMQYGYTKVPTPILACEDETIIGAPFYIMAHVKGQILRAHTAPKMGISASDSSTLSMAAADTLVALHAIDVEKTGLINLGKPEGYVLRQVEGWQKRYLAAQTDDIPAMHDVYEALIENLPPEQPPALIHNDFKFDNMVLAPNRIGEILAVLDWEMAAIGDPLMDLGATLAYWCEKEDSDLEKNFNFTWMDGHFTRAELIDYYAEKTGRDLSKIGFYHRFGLFKNAVILQQIYTRWKNGMSTDPRFKTLIHGVRLLAEKAMNIEK